MASDGEISRRLGDLERVVMARLADQELQLRALQHGATPAGGAGLVFFRIKRKARRVPASVRRRLHQRRRDWRVARERPVVSAVEARRRATVVDRYLDAQNGDTQNGSAGGGSTGRPRS